MKKALSGLQDMLTLLDEPNDFNGRLKELWEFCAHELKDIDESIVIDYLNKVDQILTDFYTSILSVDLSGDELIDTVFLAKRGRFSPSVLFNGLIDNKDNHGIDLSIGGVMILYMLSQLNEAFELIKKANNSNYTRNHISNTGIDMASTGKNRLLKEQWLLKATEFLFNAMEARRLYEKSLAKELLDIRAQKPESTSEIIYESITRADPIRRLLINAYLEEDTPKNNKFLTYEKLKSYDDEDILICMNHNSSEKQDTKFIFNINGESRSISLSNLKERMVRIRKNKR